MKTKQQYKLELDNEIALAIGAGLFGYAEIARRFGVGYVYVNEVAKKCGLSRKHGKGSPAWKNRLLAKGE